jgi:hypothetical protein
LCYTKDLLGCLSYWREGLYERADYRNRKDRICHDRSGDFAGPETDGWIAQGLDYDICVQAETPEDVHVAFENAVTAMARIALDLDKEPFEGVERRPGVTTGFTSL